MDTGELAVVLLVATSTHMDLTRIVASQPAVLSSEGHEKVITGAVKRSKVHSTIQLGWLGGYSIAFASHYTALSSWIIFTCWVLKSRLSDNASRQ